jgi:hypothetical protein
MKANAGIIKNKEKQLLKQNLFFFILDASFIDKDSSQPFWLVEIKRKLVFLYEAVRHQCNKKWKKLYEQDV